MGEQFLFFSLTSERLSPALLSHVLYLSVIAPRVQGSGQNCCVPHTCSLFASLLGLKLVDAEKLGLLSP